MRCAAAAVLPVALALALIPLHAQSAHPSARLVSAPSLPIDAKSDSNVPMVWDLVDGVPTLFAFASWGGVPALLSGAELRALREVGPIAMMPGAGHGIWMEAVIADESGAWYGFYHHEVPADACGRPDRTVLSIGLARSRDRGLTWDNLGIVLEGPPGTVACASTNALLIGGVGDPSAMLDADHNFLYLYFSQYGKPASAQGIAIARMPWADRDNPAGAFAVLNDGAWLPARRIDGAAPAWEYPEGTPLVRVTEPWHDGDNKVDAFWGASIHWNTDLERYVMLLNRAKDKDWTQEGVYVSFNREIANPRAWSAPQKILGNLRQDQWYPQVLGLDPSRLETDKLAGKTARLFVRGQSRWEIDFRRPGEP
jgi:hypothetical protein